MIDVTVKKLWNGCVSLRSNWIKIGIDRGCLLVKYKKQSMSIPIPALKKLLKSKPSLYIKSKYGGTYGLHDFLWSPEDNRQGQLFNREADNG